MIRKAVLLVAALALAATSVHAAGVTKDPLQDAFTAYGNSGQGWTGGDGAYSVPLSDGRTVWLFSDTFLGTVNPDGSRSTATPLIRNSLVVEDAGEFSTIIGDNPFEPRAAVDTPDRSSWFWMGDGTVEGSTLKIFLFHFIPVPGPLLFQQIGVWLATFSLPGITLQSVEPLPRAFTPSPSLAPASYGSGILERADHTYVYGVADMRSEKYLYVARTPPGNVMGQWEYWTGAAWSADALDAKPVLDGVANELSVSEIDGEFVLVTQDHAIGKDIHAYTASSPQGPFEGPRVLYTAPEDGSLVTYNAKAHPGRGPPGTLLVTYNVNSTVFQDLYADVSIYRPRFIDVPLALGGGRS